MGVGLGIRGRDFWFWRVGFVVNISNVERAGFSGQRIVGHKIFGFYPLNFIAVILVKISGVSGPKPKIK